MARKTTFPIGSRLDWVNYFNQVLKAFDTHCSDSIGLNVTQCRILFHTVLFPHTPIGNIANRLKLKASTTTAAYDGLEEKNLVFRDITGDDKRNVFVEATEKGEMLSLGYLDSLIYVFNNYRDKFLENQRDDILSILSENKASEIPSYIEALLKFSEQHKSDFDFEKKYECTFEKLALYIACFENICSFIARSIILDRSTGLTPNEARSLRSIALFDRPINIKDITSFISIRPNVATVSITGLTTKGLIERTVDKKDRRSASITLSEKGVQYIKDTNSEFIKLFDTCFPSAAKSKIDFSAI